ncbi:SHQ1 protein-domain-containing protein [Zychaea mexicana]|uniref:SHQ1 protein-domain-containing protein n=1 Tax=Zychaea mexicana TaxID=64656 RepID=UPI0022FE6A43|nr:SHQ1 protein-domain-containing protein [Zychaea mexicana]KAI9490919.1 SHQ1 protein-domain-containing protein [Zychaea mexicana]
MITPTFKVDQDDNAVIITINTPYVRAQDVDLHVQGSEFRFFLRPYFLRLYFPGNIVEDDDSSAKYDPSSGQFHVRITKENKGEHFTDLDLLSKLLARRGEAPEESNKKTTKPLIEVIGGEDNVDEQQEQVQDENIQEAIDFNWELPQELPTTEILTTASYGFNNQYSNYFIHVQETMNEINDISDPEKSTVESRRRERCEAEDAKFDEDYYAMDFINDEEIQRVMQFKTVWHKELRRIQKIAKEQQTKAPLIQEMQAPGSVDGLLDLQSLSITDSAESLIKFTEKEQAMMRDLPKKEYLLSNEKITYLGLVDLLFAYSYNHRIFEGEDSVESVWCIGKTSPTIACLEQFTTLKEVLVANYRRSLAYPLYRNFALCEKVMQDVYILMRLGKRAILKALLSLKVLFDHHDVYYVYSKIYLDDYCTWIQHTSDHVLRTLAHELHHFSVSKSEIGWDLEEIETIAKEMQNSQEEAG